MAVARCKKHSPPTGLKHAFKHRHEVTSGKRLPLCSAQGCISRADLWLTDEEEQEYSEGKRRFSRYKECDLA